MEKVKLWKKISEFGFPSNQELTFARSSQICSASGDCGTNLKTMYKFEFSKQQRTPLNKKMITFVSLMIVFVSLCTPGVQGAYRYSLESCSDLVPRHVSDRPENYQAQEDQQPNSSWRSGSSGGSGSSLRRNKRGDSYNDSPFKLTVPGKRYRQNSELYVQLEGRGYYDAMMIQGRAVSSAGDFISGGVGLLGKFDPGKLERKNFSYIECFRQSHGTVVDTGFTKLGNASFTWSSPDSDRGDIRFLAGVTKKDHYWIIVSSILHFNPFPISTVQCGGAEACFRVCPLDIGDGMCSSENSLLMYNYNTDLAGKRDVEFTLGGKLTSTQTSYIAVVYAEDNENLYQADVTICYLEHGRAMVGHFFLDVAGSSLIQHQEEINIDDYDYDGNTLWCRYRRPISHLSTSVINPWRSFYTLLYKGEINPMVHPKFQTPPRTSMYSSDMKLNLSTPINEIYAGSGRISHLAPTGHAFLILVYSYLTANVVSYF